MINKSRDSFQIFLVHNVYEYDNMGSFFTDNARLGLV